MCRSLPAELDWNLTKPDSDDDDGGGGGFEVADSLYDMQFYVCIYVYRWVNLTKPVFILKVSNTQIETMKRHLNEVLRDTLSLF